MSFPGRTSTAFCRIFHFFMVWGLNLFLFREHMSRLISSGQKEAAGRVRLTIEAKLSPGPMLNLRRHGVIGCWHGLVDNVASGNFLGAKRRGVVNVIDYGFTGEVKKVDVSRIKERLDNDSIVVVSNMGYSSSGEVLNCKWSDIR